MAAVQCLIICACCYASETRLIEGRVLRAEEYSYSAGQEQALLTREWRALGQADAAAAAHDKQPSSQTILPLLLYKLASKASSKQQPTEQRGKRLHAAERLSSSLYACTLRRSTAATSTRQATATTTLAPLLYEYPLMPSPSPAAFMSSVFSLIATSQPSSESLPPDWPPVQPS